MTAKSSSGFLGSLCDWASFPLKMNHKAQKWQTSRFEKSNEPQKRLVHSYLFLISFQQKKNRGWSCYLSQGVRISFIDFVLRWLWITRFMFSCLSHPAVSWISASLNYVIYLFVVWKPRPRPHPCQLIPVLFASTAKIGLFRIAFFIFRSFFRSFFDILYNSEILGE